MTCPKCGAPTDGACDVHRFEDIDVSSECSKPDCDTTVYYVSFCDEHSKRGEKARKSAGTVITGPDAGDHHYIGGER